MSKRCVLAVFDSAVQAFGQPFFVPAIGAGVRSFVDEVNRAAPDNSLANHPEDYELSYIADFDDELGEFTKPADGVRVIARGKDVKQS